MESSFVDLGDGRIEYVRIVGTGPQLVLLHEGLGSVAMWRDFPAALATATGAEVIVYSRYSYGCSSPLKRPRKVDYMAGEARDVLPAFLKALGIERPILLGHSDGASIALIYAGSGLPSAGVVVMAPHVFVEDVTIASIAAAKDAYLKTDLPQRLGRYHDSADGAFWGWNDIWLDPAFRSWNIEALLPSITVPILAIQGEGDEYGTAAQVDAVRRSAKAPCEIVLLPDCRHSPHRDQPQKTIALIKRFIASPPHPAPG
jgi:pimeloyl-ACP methyl ester carboxylesterase